MIALALTSMILAFVNTTLAARVSEGFAADLRSKAFENIQSFSFANLDKLQTGELLVRMTSDINIAKMAVMMTMRILFRAPLMLIGSLIMLIVISPKLALLLLALIPAILIMIWIMSTKARPLFRTVQERLEKVNTVMHENVAGVRLVKAFVRADHEKGRFQAANEELMKKSVKVHRMMSTMMPTMLLILNLGMVALLWFGGNMVIVGTLTTGQIIAFFNYLMMTTFPIILLAMILPQYYAVTASIDRVNEVLETRATVVFSENTADKITKGQVTFENVSLDYDGEENEHMPVLQNINFTANPGETVAILGATGSGKTSLINLIPRLYDPTEGRVLIDGADVRDLNHAELRRNISVALQNAILFSGTIADNIRFGRPEASDEEVIEAAKIAQAHEFIIGKENGYKAEVGQRGSNFSGGQKQRLAIARALCVTPKVLILDDSTSSVDVETEAEIQIALEKLMQDLTSFVVAHRLSTIRNADQILVINDGQLIERGNHEELLNARGFYYNLYTSQFKGLLMEV